MVKTEGKEEGVFEENVQEVVYIYEPLDAENGSSVVARYVDENGNTLKDDIILNGDLGDDYETHKENISGYILIRVEGEEKGEFEEDVKVVKYIYKKISGTNVDVDGDGKPDINIDTDGDGVPDVNIDTNGDGIADKNLIGNNESSKIKSDSANGDLGSVKTGDDNNIHVYGIIICVSLLGIFITIRKMKFIK